MKAGEAVSFFVQFDVINLLKNPVYMKGREQNLRVSELHNWDHMFPCYSGFSGTEEYMSHEANLRRSSAS